MAERGFLFKRHKRLRLANEMLISTTVVAETSPIPAPETRRRDSTRRVLLLGTRRCRRCDRLDYRRGRGRRRDPYVVPAAALHVPCRDALPSCKAGSGKKDDLPHYR